MRADDQAQDDMPRKCVWGRLFLCLHFQSLNTALKSHICTQILTVFNELQIRFVLHIRLDLIKRRYLVYGVCKNLHNHAQNIL